MPNGGTFGGMNLETGGISRAGEELALIYREIQPLDRAARSVRADVCKR